MSFSPSRSRGRRVQITAGADGTHIYELREQDPQGPSFLKLATRMLALGFRVEGSRVKGLGFWV